MSERQRKIARKTARSMVRDAHGRYLPRPKYTVVPTGNQQVDQYFEVINTRLSAVLMKLQQMNNKLDEIDDLIRLS